MDLGICEQSFIPMRSSFSHRAEMVSQILFGEIFEIVSRRGEWLKIKLLNDDYEGYVEEAATTHLLINTDNLLNGYHNSIVCYEINNRFIKNNKEPVLLPIGAKIPRSILSENKFYINENSYCSKTQLTEPEISDKRNFAVEISKTLINTPYLWGGRTGWGIDCSGLSQLVYKLIGIDIPRDANQQVTLGTTLSFMSEAKPGDLAFFDNEDGEIIHVGMILENNSIIHASKCVRIDSIDHQGIYNRALKKYTHNLRVIKSFI